MDWRKEMNSDVVDEVKRRKLDKNRFEDYVEIQRLWINREIERWKKVKAYPHSIMDFGAEEIDFYTRNYPKTIGQSWEVESALKKELDEMEKCMPARILFLDASEETLRAHKESDRTRTRSFFEHYIQYLLPRKREWFYKKENVDILIVDGLDKEQVGGK